MPVESTPLRKGLKLTLVESLDARYGYNFAKFCASCLVLVFFANAIVLLGGLGASSPADFRDVILTKVFAGEPIGGNSKTTCWHVAGLALSIVPSCFVCRGVNVIKTRYLLMAIGIVLWFATAPFWLKSKSLVEEKHFIALVVKTFYYCDGKIVA